MLIAVFISCLSLGFGGFAMLTWACDGGGSGVALGAWNVLLRAISASTSLRILSMLTGRSVVLSLNRYLHQAAGVCVREGV